MRAERVKEDLAIDTIRTMIPSVPVVGANRIAIRDEIELEMAL